MDVFEHLESNTVLFFFAGRSRILSTSLSTSTRTPCSNVYSSITELHVILCFSLQTSSDLGRVPGCPPLPSSVDKLQTNAASFMQVGAKALISAFEHLDSNTVLNVLLSMQVEEQVALRRLLQKYTARIDNDFLQIQTIRQKKYKVTPANGAAMQAGEENT